MQITKLDTQPTNKKLFNWLAELARVATLVVKTRGGQRYTYSNERGTGRCILVCTATSKRPTYSLRQRVLPRITICRRCGQTVCKGRPAHRHKVLCSKQRGEVEVRGKAAKQLVKLKIAEGKFRGRKTVRDRLEDVGIPQNAAFQSNGFCVLDCEAMLAPLRGDGKSSSDCLLESSANLQYSSAHELVLTVVAYKLPGQNAVSTKEFWCKPGRHPYGSIIKLVRFLNKLSDENCDYLHKYKFNKVFLQLRRLEMSNFGNNFVLMKVKAAKQALMEHCRVLPIITFNGGSYDIHLMRRYGLFQALKKPSVIKRDSKYLEVRTDKLRFSDILLYSPMKCNLRTFLSTFGAAGDEKGFFCYQRLTCFDDLKLEIDRIQYDAFNDSLIRSNQLAVPYNRYVQLMRTGQSEAVALKQLGLKQRPSKGRDVFWKLKEEWSRRGFKNLKDVLRAYSLQDVAPLLAACEGFQAAFAHLGLGLIFNSFISLPQISFYYILGANEAENDFFLLDKYMYTSLKKHLVGGPSIVYTRYVRKNESKIKEVEFGADAEVVRDILTYDISSFYASIMRDTEFPVGPYAVRRRCNNFESVVINTKTNDAILWLGYMQMTETKNKIRTTYNSGEVEIHIASLGKTYRVDGCSKEDDGRLLIFEMLECGTHHGTCPSCVRELLKAGKNETLRSAQLRKETMDRIGAIKSQSCVSNVVVQWMCSWLRKKRKDPQIRDFCARFQHGESAKFYMHEKDLLDDILITDKLHGMILATFKVAERRWAETDEFPLFFKHANVEPMGALRDLLLADGQKIKSSHRVVQSHSMRGWMTTANLKYYSELIGDDLIISNIEVRYYICIYIRLHTYM